LEVFMKKGLFGFYFLSVLVLSSCISLDARQMSSAERTEMQVLGTVTAKWIQVNVLHIPPSAKALESKAISELKAAAQKQGYKGNIDIKNISVAGSFNGLTLLPLFPHFGVFGNFQTVVASGDVVEYVTQSGSNRNTATGVEGALARAAQETLKNVPQRSKIAIVYITAQDRSTTEYVAGELEYIWVNAGYTIIDRSQLDRIRREQNFQMSGEVDDNTAVSIGKIIGANIIVTGRVDGEGNLRRLRLRALDTQTAQVVGVSSERL
jgi:hypothetical protein